MGCRRSGKGYEVKGLVIYTNYPGVPGWDQKVNVVDYESGNSIGFSTEQDCCEAFDYKMEGPRYYAPIQDGASLRSYDLWSDDRFSWRDKDGKRYWAWGYNTLPDGSKQGWHGYPEDMGGWPGSDRAWVPGWSLPDQSPVERCPTTDDDTASVSWKIISENGEDGRITFSNCHNGYYSHCYYVNGKPAGSI